MRNGLRALYRHSGDRI